MSYVAEIEDISKAYEEYREASEQLSSTLYSAKDNAQFSVDQVLTCMQLGAQLTADKYKIERDIKELLGGE